MRGRLPKPAAVRELHNSKRRPYHGTEATIPDETPAVETEGPRVPKPPPALNADGRKYWDEYAPLLTAARLLTPADRETLADYCRCCAIVAHRGKALDAEWRKRRPDHGRLKMLDTQLRGWVERKTKLAGELGLTAISRTRAGWTGHKPVIDKKEKPASKLGSLQARAAAMRREITGKAAPMPPASTAKH